MSENSKIEWTDATWNPLRVASHQWYCEKISPGCDNCYASMFNHRWGAPEYPVVGRNERPDVRLDEKALMLPHSWKRPKMVFVCSMTDIAGEWIEFDWFHAMWTVMAETPRHTYQVLTKRPNRLKTFIERFQADAPGFGPYPLPNVWIGSTVESDAYTWRANVLRETPATIRFVSAEPLLSGLPSLNLDGIDWLIVGGESGGPKKRQLVMPCVNDDMGSGYKPEPCGTNCYACQGTRLTPNPDGYRWVTDLHRRCQDEGVAFFLKQWGGRSPKAAGRLLYDRTWDEMPAPPAPVEVLP